MALFCYVNATALKAMHKAGRRGGDSIARKACKHVCGPFQIDDGALQ